MAQHALFGGDRIGVGFRGRNQLPFGFAGTQIRSEEAYAVAGEEAVYIRKAGGNGSVPQIQDLGIRPQDRPIRRAVADTEDFAARHSHKASEGFFSGGGKNAVGLQH